MMMRARVVDIDLNECKRKKDICQILPYHVLTQNHRSPKELHTYIGNYNFTLEL